MCIIIYKPAEVKLFDKTIERSFANNADGAGFSYIENNELITQRGFFTIKAFKEAYKPHEMKQALLHFRIKTHGEINTENCHPHNISPHLVFAHNGVISRMPYDKEKSDTLLFNDLLLINLVRIYGKRIVFDKYFKVLLANFVGMSKLVFMNNQGQISIINEKDGIWDSRCWFSNDSYSRDPYQYVEPLNQTNWNKKEKKKNKRGTNIIPYQPRLDETPSSPRPTPFSPLKTGDYVRLLYESNGLPPRSVGKCMGFYTDGLIEVYFPLTRMARKLSVMYLEKIEFNHQPPHLLPQEE